MNKVILYLAIPLLLVSVDALPQEASIPDEVNINREWIDTYIYMLDQYMEDCGRELRDLSETEQYACDKLKSVINLEAEKKIALSQHTVDTFRRQGVASNIVLALVVVVVLSGILLAAYQLRIAAVNGGPQSSTDLEASAAKVRITSSSVGLTILVLSLLFLYLYVKEIYNINVIPI